MANMTTNLVIKPQEIKAGREIDVHSYPINNYNLHKGLTALSRLILATMENQSNNQKAELVPRDVAALRSGWAAFNETWKSALTHNDPPSGTHELNYIVLLPTGVEIQKIPNFKLKIMVMEFTRLADIILSCDSAGASGNIGRQTQADIETQIGICDDEFTKWLGTGTDNSSVGLTVPVFKWLGNLNPDVDFDYAGVSEPSADTPLLGRPDVKDTPIVTGD